MKNQEKITEVNTLISQINQTFGIDLTSKSRDYKLNWFKHYIVAKYESYPQTIICEVFKICPASAFRFKANLSKNKNRKQFIVIRKVVETMDVKLYEKFILDHATQKYVTRPEVPQEPVKKRPKTLIEVILILRKKKKHKLWDKPFNKWSASDFRELEKLNN